MKPRTFIGSSVEGLPIARAIQAELQRDTEVTIWSQGIFKLSEETLTALEKALVEFDFAIFVFSPDDSSKVRERRYKAVRDNVIFEFGLFIGRLGKGRVFFLTPGDEKSLRLPTDLLGITPGEYLSRSDRNWQAAVGPFCEQVRALISTRWDKGKIQRHSMFQEFDDTFRRLFQTAKEITLFFIHSRAWRENYHNAILEFLARDSKNQLRVFLPDMDIEQLRRAITTSFEDGQLIPSLIEDAIAFFIRLKRDFPKSVSIRLYSIIPTYSFYKFDDTAVVAMYPTTVEKKNVPAFEVKEGSDFGAFLKRDIAILSNEHTSRVLEETAKS